MGSRKIGKYIRLNASRSGISASIGVKGMRLSIGTKGIRTHLTVPGTGYTKTNTLLSFRKLLKGKSKKAKNNKDIKKPSTKPAVDQVDDSTQEVALVGDELVLIMSRRRVGFLGGGGKGNKLVNQAVEAYRKEDFQGTVDLLKEAKSLLPEDKEICLYLAVLHYLYLEDYQQAVQYFDELDEDMYNEDMKLAIADCLHELGDWDYSTTVLESFSFEDDEDMERMTLLARNHMEKNNLPVAEALLKQVIGRKRKMTPYLMDAKYWLGVLYLKLNDYDQAKENLMAVYMADSSYEEIGAKVEELAMSGSEA